MSVQEKAIESSSFYIAKFEKLIECRLGFCSAEPFIQTKVVVLYFAYFKNHSITWKYMF